MAYLLDEPSQPIKHQVLIDGTLDEQTDILERACHEHGVIYRRDRTPVHIVQSDAGRDVIDEIGVNRMIFQLARHFDLRQTKDIDGEPTPVRVDPSAKLAKNLIEACSKSPYIDILEGVRRTPIYGSDWSLSTARGYRPETRTWVDLGKDRIKAVTGREVERATALLNDLVRDFPFDKEASRTNALATLITHFIRPAVDLVPMSLVTAPTAGSGKTYMTQIFCRICHDADPSINTVSEAAELEKRITSYLMTNSPFIVLENISTGHFTSGSLAAMLTSREWTGRILGASKMVTLKNTAQWMMTSNNPDLSHELIRRVLPIRLEPEVEKPADRKLRDLDAHVAQHRLELVWACLEVIEHWRLQGMPTADITWGSYQTWCETVGGIMECAGWEGLASNRGDIASHERDEIGVFVDKWGRAKQPGKKWRASEIVDWAEDEHLLHDVIGQTTSASWKSRNVAAWMRGHKGRVVQGRKICSEIDSHSEQEVWFLERISN